MRRVVPSILTWMIDRLNVMEKGCQHLAADERERAYASSGAVRTGGERKEQRDDVCWPGRVHEFQAGESSVSAMLLQKMPPL